MLVAIISIIAVGTACFVGTYGTYRNLINEQASYYSQCRMADFWIDVKKVPRYVLKELTGVKGVSEIYGRIISPVIVEFDDVSQPISGCVVSLPANPKPVINNIVMRRGSYFTKERENEVIVSEIFAKTRNISPGSYIKLIMNGKQKELFVVGTAISSEFIYMLPPGGIVPEPGNYGVFWIKNEFAEDRFGFTGACNSIVGILNPESRQNPYPVLDELNRKLSPYGVFASTPLKNQNSNLTLCAELSGLQLETTVIPGIFLGVAALALNILMMRMAEQQRVIIGTLKALGIKNSSIFMHFMKFGLFTGISGGIAGCVLGYWMAFETTQLYASIYTFPDLRNYIYPDIIALSMLISISFAALGTLKGVRKIVKLNPAESMRPSVPTSSKKIFLEKFSSFWNRAGFRWQIVLRNIFRNKGRTAIGMAAAACGAGIVVMSFGLTDSLEYMMQFQFDKVLLSDYSINFRDELDGGALYEARRLPGISYAEPVLNVTCDLHNRNHFRKASITGIIPNARLTFPSNADGKPIILPSAGLLMSGRLAKQLHLKTGDSVTFIPVKGRKKTQTVPIAGIIDSKFGMPIYADYYYLNKLIDENSAISSIHLKASDRGAHIKELFNAVRAFPKLASLSVTAQQKKQMQEDFIAKLKGIVYVMIVFAGVIFFGSILNSALISLTERKREIATFRILGYQPLEVGAIFFREIMTINVAGTIIGLPLGYYMLYGMTLSFQNDMYSVPCVINRVTWLNTLIIAFIFIIAAYFLIQRLINRMDWSEALKLRE